MSEFETKATDARIELAGGMVRSPSDGKRDYTLVRKGPLFERWVALLSRGAAVYGKNNWLLALKATDVDKRTETKERFIESAARHFEQWLAGDRSEDHAAAVIFNMNGFEAMLDTDPALAKLERAAQPAPDPERSPSPMPCSDPSCNTCAPLRGATRSEGVRW